MVSSGWAAISVARLLVAAFLVLSSAGDWQSFTGRCSSGMAEAAVRQSAVNSETALNVVAHCTSSVGTFLSGQRTLAKGEKPCLKDPHRRDSDPETIS